MLRTLREDGRRDQKTDEESRGQQPILEEGQIELALHRSEIRAMRLVYKHAKIMKIALFITTQAFVDSSPEALFP